VAVATTGVPCFACDYAGDGWGHHQPHVAQAPAVFSWQHVGWLCRSRAGSELRRLAELHHGRAWRRVRKALNVRTVTLHFLLVSYSSLVIAAIGEASQLGP
jgi:hypothetical protein